MSIRSKIILAFLLMSAFLVIQSLVSVQSNDRLRELVDLAVEKNYHAVGSINGLISDMQKLRRYEKEYFIYITDPVKKAKYARQWQGIFDETRGHLADMIRNPSGVFTGNDVLRFSDWDSSVRFYGAEFAKIEDQYNTVSTTAAAVGRLSIEANALIHEGKTRFGKAMADAARMSAAKTEESLGVVAEVDERFSSVKLISLSLTGAAILLAVILIFVVPGGIHQTLGRLLEDAERISKGDLSSPVEPSPVPEFNSLADSLETIRKSELAYSQRTGSQRRG